MSTISERRELTQTSRPRQFEDLKASGSLKPDLWKDNRDEIIPTLEKDYPQLGALNHVIEQHCEKEEQKGCLDAVRELFISVGVFASNHKNHSSLRLIQTWPMHLDPTCLKMFESHHPVGLVILAHYAAMMSMRSNYWFFNRWPRLLLDGVAGLLEQDWHSYLDWPRRMVLESQGAAEDSITKSALRSQSLASILNDPAE